MMGLRVRIVLKAYGYSSVLSVVCYIGSSLCDGLIAGTEESYRLCVCVCLIVCDLGTSTVRGPGPQMGLLRLTYLLHGAESFLRS